MKKTKWKKQLITAVLAIAVIVVLSEFEKWMKGRSSECVTCPVPHDHGLHIDPFPEEIVPQGIETNQTTKGAKYE